MAEARQQSVAVRAAKAKVRRESVADSRGIGLFDIYVALHLSGGLCFYCREVKATTIDHVVPLCRGGRDDGDNILGCCRYCNSSKGPRLIMEWGRRRHLPPAIYAVLRDHTLNYPTLCERSGEKINEIGREALRALG